MKSKLFLALAVMVVFGLYAFASHRFKAREVRKVEIKFLGKADPLISEKNVNKLLIQNQDTVQKLYLENLALNESELRLVNNAMIRNSEVSVTLDGELNVVVEQREPIARVVSNVHKYLDHDNKLMPLSVEHSVRVPLIYGFTEDVQDQVYELMMFLRSDPVLEPSFSVVYINKDGSVLLTPRAYNFKVVLGKVDDLTMKMEKYKAFITKMSKDKRLNELKSVDLRYKKQVVTTKK
jgi:cell division protein FtsQ